MESDEMESPGIGTKIKSKGRKIKSKVGAILALPCLY